MDNANIYSLKNPDSDIKELIFHEKQWVYNLCVYFDKLDYRLVLFYIKITIKITYIKY